MKIDKKELEAYRARKKEAKKSPLYKDMQGDTVSFATSFLSFRPSIFILFFK